MSAALAVEHVVRHFDPHPPVEPGHPAPAVTGTPPTQLQYPNKSVSQISTPSNQDKRYWCEAYGITTEKLFVDTALEGLDVTGYINPAKEINKYTHDLYLQVQSDLKTVRTPFFKSMEYHGIDPQYAVTFNKKDALRYSDKYPNILVVFDVKWEPENCAKVIAEKPYQVDPMHLIAVGFLSDIAKAIREDGDQVIRYMQRQDDTAGNAKESYVFDVRRLHLLKGRQH